MIESLLMVDSIVIRARTFARTILERMNRAVGADRLRPGATRLRFRPGFLALAVLALAGTAAVRIVSTYHVFNQNFDEPDHIAGGMEWLDRGTYTIDREGPPLARVATALGPFLAGLRMPLGGGTWIEQGNQILYAHGQYSHNLALARVGVLPFFFLATAVVFAWSRKTFGDVSALLAVLLFTTLPPVLAHAGFATIDMALAATFSTAMLAFVYLLERPTYGRCCMFGLTAGLTVLSKLSALLFLPACGLALLACFLATQPRAVSAQVVWHRRAAAIVLILMTTFLVIWAGYRFSVRFISETDRPHRTIDSIVGAEGTLHRLAYLVTEHVPIPAPDLITGIDMLRLHALRGHQSFLLGEVRKTGWWYFFPVALAVKTPLPFLLLSGIGFVALVKQWRPRADWRALAPAVMALTILLVCMPSTINIGLRHILPIYSLLAIVAGFGAVSLWSLDRPKRLGPAIVSGLLLWQLTASVRAHPDYLAYFNELAGRHPDKVLVVGDLDWGQDLLRLANALHERNIDSVALVYHGTADPSRHNLPHWWNLQPCQSATGWIAISEKELKVGWGDPPYRAWDWLDAYEPNAIVGKSIRLYYIEKGSAAPTGERVSGSRGCP